MLGFAYASVNMFFCSSLHTAIFNVAVVLLIFGVLALSCFSVAFSVLSQALLSMVSLEYTANIIALFWAGAVSFRILHV